MPSPPPLRPIRAGPEPAHAPGDQILFRREPFRSTMPHPPDARRFRAALMDVLTDALDEGKRELIVNSGDLHRKVGHYPGPDHRMPTCCDVMRQEYVAGRDEILEQPPEERGANVTIRYVLPRPRR